jgi:starvation-inducible DNA-binding protein
VLRDTQLIFADEKHSSGGLWFVVASAVLRAEFQYLVEIRRRRLQMTAREAKSLRIAPLATPTDLQPNAVRDIAGALNILLADMFGLYLKTKNFHWHVSGPHFRDYHLLLDEHGDQIFATTDPIAERIRKLGGTTMRSIGQITRLQRIKDNDADFVTPMDMLAELRDDNKQLTASMRETHDLCDEHGDVATTSLLEIWIDEAERRTWFLFEATRAARGE